MTGMELTGMELIGVGCVVVLIAGMAIPAFIVCMRD